MENLTTSNRKQNITSLASRLQFFICMFPNDNIVMQGLAEESVKSVHRRIESRTGILILDQKLIHARKQIRWKQSLGECDIQNNATLQLVAHLRSGGDYSRQHAVVEDMLDLILDISGEGSSTTERCMRMMLKLSTLDNFMYKRGPQVLARLYRSE